jgi:hypothetical protein
MGFDALMGSGEDDPAPPRIRTGLRGNATGLWVVPFQNSDIENSSSRDWRRNSRPSVRDVRYSSPKTGPFTANPRECRHPPSTGTDRRETIVAGWAYRIRTWKCRNQNPAGSHGVISAHFEKVRRFGPFLKRLAVISECRAMVTAYQRHTRPSPTSACGPALSLVWRVEIGNSQFRSARLEGRRRARSCQRPSFETPCFARLLHDEVRRALLGCPQRGQAAGEHARQKGLPQDGQGA